jgi:hypothetical protein
MLKDFYLMALPQHLEAFLNEAKQICRKLIHFCDTSEQLLHVSISMTFPYQLID